MMSLSWWCLCVCTLSLWDSFKLWLFLRTQWTGRVCTSKWLSWFWCILFSWGWGVLSVSRGKSLWEQFEKRIWNAVVIGRHLKCLKVPFTFPPRYERCGRSVYQKKYTPCSNNYLKVNFFKYLSHFKTISFLHFIYPMKNSLKPEWLTQSLESTGESHDG